MKRIDSHQHFWQVERGDYAWLTPELNTLYQDFLPKDIQQYLSSEKVSQTIVVQAADTIAETEFMLGLAQQHDFIAGVVGWVDMENPDAIAQLTRLKQSQYFKGIRPMIQEIENVDWMLSPELTPVFDALIDLELTFDALVLPKHLANLNQLLNKHPKLKVVIDHGAKPNIADAKGIAISQSMNKQWAEDLKALSKHPNVYCKLSGLLTEAGEQADYADIEPYMSHLLNCFGPAKLMWGSDWPVVNLSADYPSWINQLETFLAKLSKEEQQCIWADNAQTFYRIL